VITLALVITAIVAAAKIHPGTVTRDVGFTGTTPAALPAAVIGQGKAADVTVRPRYYGGVAAGEKAIRDQTVAVLVVDARRLTWRSQPDERLRAIVTTAIQLVTVQQRAAAAGIGPGQLHAVMAPVPVGSEQLGVTAGRSPDNANAAIIMSMLLLLAIVLYGNLVLTGVAEEKSSRVVEVLLARMPARTLLAGKVAGIGLLGFAQFAVTALVALVAALAVHPAGIPAVSGGVLAWVIVWFIRPGRARRTRLHRRHPAHRTDPEAKRRLERHNPDRPERGRAPAHRTSTPRGRPRAPWQDDDGKANTPQRNRRGVLL
jgi:ABC-2 type transport system permease protein